MRDTASMATIVGPGTLPARKLEDLSAFDAVGIQCRQTVSPECETVFKASPSFWHPQMPKVNLSKGAQKLQFNE